MINYLGIFIKNLPSIKTEGLRYLVRKDVPWVWDSNHEQAFTDRKRTITSFPDLAYFDVKK